MSISSSPHIDEFGVYDLENSQQLDIVNSRGRAVWLKGNNLYIIRHEGEWIPGRNRPKSTLYVLNLKTGAEESVWEEIYYWARVNGEKAFWLVNYPEECNEVRSCEEAYQTRCVRQVIALDLATGKRASLGILHRNTSLSRVSSDLVTLSEEFSSCDVKWYQGPIQVIDLDSKEYRVVSRGSVSPGPPVYTVGLIERTLAYLIGDLTYVLQIEPHETVKVFVLNEKIHAQGLAGRNVLLYTPIDEGHSWPQKGLVALNMKNGYSQELDNEKYIRSATGDGQHVTWTTDSGELYVASLKLISPQHPTIFDSPIPTLPSRFRSPLPMPTWFPPTTPDP